MNLFILRQTKKRFNTISWGRKGEICFAPTEYPTTSQRAKKVHYQVFRHLLFIFLLMIGFCGIPRAFAQTFEFEPAECPEEVGVSVTECGYVAVPENWDKPNGKQIRIAVAVFKSVADTPEPDPAIYLEGGPGFGTLQNSWMWSSSTILQNRDLILFDQRGTGFSEPLLQCPNLLDPAHYTEEMSDDEQLAAELEQLQICWDNFEAEGIDLDGYHTPAIAADVEAIRIALGYDQLNLYGISYGTRIALTVMRDFPDGVRSAVIDSVVPLHSEEQSNFPRYTLQQFKALFESCAADSECNQAYPDLETVFNETVDRLNETPVEVTLPTKNGESVTDSIDGKLFQSAVFMAMYDSTMLPAVPAMIYAVHQENYTSVQIGLLAENDMVDDYILGMTFSLRCAEIEPFTDYDSIKTQIDQADSRWKPFFEINDLQKLCEIWDITSLGAIEDQPVVSDIPTLVISGEYDPITPPEEGVVAAETLSNHYLYEIPAAGHGATADSLLSGLQTMFPLLAESFEAECGQSIRDDFLDNPHEEPDSSCIDSLDEPQYLTDIQMRKGWFKFARNLIVPASMATWVTAGTSLKMMIYVLLSAPIAWMKRARQPVEERTPWRGRIARYMLAIITLFSLFFLITLTYVLTDALLFQEQTGYFMVGPSSAWNLLLVIPWLTLIGTIVASFFTLINWNERLGGIVGRIFYTIGTVAVIAYHIVLWMFGFFG